jgi:hypothetical protein
MNYGLEVTLNKYHEIFVKKKFYIEYLSNSIFRKFDEEGREWKYI